MPFPTYTIKLTVAGTWESQVSFPWQSEPTLWEQWTTAEGAWDSGVWDTARWDEETSVTDDETELWRSSEPLNTFRGLDTIQPAMPARAGTAQFVLDNLDGRFNPPGGAVVKGEPVAVTATYSAVTYPFWWGNVDYPTQRTGLANQVVEVPCLGALSAMIPSVGGGLKMSTALYQNITTDQAIGYILDQVGWPASRRSLDVGKTTLLWWWVLDADPWSEIQRIMAAEGPTAALYEDASGNIVFKNRWQLSSLTRCRVSQATWSDVAGAAIQLAQPFTYDDGLKYLVNTAKWQTNLRTAKALATIWMGPASIVLSPNQVLKYNPIAMSGDPYTAAVEPVNGVDYTLDAGAVVMTLNRTSGASVVLTLAAGAAGAAIKNLEMRAQVVSVDETTNVNNGVGSPLSTATLARPLNVPQTPEITPLTAQGLVDSYVGLWQNGRPVVTVTFINISDAVLLQQLSREVLDRVTVVEQGLGLNSDFIVASVSHEVTAGGALLKTTFKCILASAVYSSWDVALWDTGLWGF